MSNLNRKQRRALNAIDRKTKGADTAPGAKLNTGFLSIGKEDVPLTDTELSKLDSLHHDNAAFTRYVARIAASRGLDFPPKNCTPFTEATVHSGNC